MEYYKLIKACDYVSQKCTKIADTQHGSAWLFDKLCRYFDKEKSAVSINIPVYINCVGKGIATVSRDGDYKFMTLQSAENLGLL